MSYSKIIDGHLLILKKIKLLEYNCPKRGLLRCILAAAKAAYFDHKKHADLHEPCLFTVLCFSIM